MNCRILVTSVVSKVAVFATFGTNVLFFVALCSQKWYNKQASNQRKDFCHKESRKIANSWDTVCVEDIDLRAMSGALRLGKSTMDNGFGMFRVFLQYKLEEQGKHFVVIDKWYPSTKTCNHCGAYYPDVKLGQKEWTCPSCHKVLQRDPNAAKNIRDEGFRTIKRRMEDIRLAV